MPFKRASSWVETTFAITTAKAMVIKKKAKAVEDLVAQLVEHYTFNVRVLGSNPSGVT